MARSPNGGGRKMEKTMLRLSRLAAGVGLGMMLTACGGAGDPNDPADPSAQPNQDVAQEEPVAHTMEAATGCLTFQRGVNGTVFDTEIQQATPGQNFGNAGTMLAGHTNATLSQALVWFDLSTIPGGNSIIVLSSTLTLVQSDPNGPTTFGSVNVHRITTPPTSSCSGGICPASGWSEGTVNYTTFAESFDATTWGSFTSSASGTVNVDLTTLTQAWLNGTYLNHGILLDEPGAANHDDFMPTSENPTRQFRPKLTVCYASDAGHQGTALLSGGAKASSPFYQGVLSLGESPGGNFLASPNYTFHGGVVGATQSK